MAGAAPALVGVVGCLLLAAALPTWWGRRRLRHSPGVFTCRLRPVGPVDTRGWTRAKRHGRWVHDVLLLHRGPGLVRCEALGVASVTGPAAALGVRGLGPRPMLFRLHLDDGRVLELVTSRGQVTPAIGPFVVASMM